MDSRQAISSVPETLIEAIRYFADPDTCIQFVAALRWPNGIACPHCGAKDPGYLSTRRIFKCKNKECRKQFSVKVGSIFEDSPIGLDKWLTTIWMIANCKNGVSSYEIARNLGVTQKTGWFMLHRVRVAMQTGTFEKLSGEVEADETFIGGKGKNMHKSAKAKKIQGRGASGKDVVMGILERGGEDKPSRVRATVVPNTAKTTLQREIWKTVEQGAAIYTDAHAGYQGMPEEQYTHEFVDHAVKYVEGRIHTNGLENFWSLLKRSF